MLPRLQQLAAVAFAIALASTPNVAHPTVWMIGDSTMANKPDGEFNPEHGWGQALPALLGSRVVVENRAVNGRSSKSFIDEGRWVAVEGALKAGDVVIIQFGHNDEKKEDSTRYADADGAYRANLERFVREARAKGAVPVLCTSIARRKFDAAGLRIDTHGRYPVVTREVARTLRVPLLDLAASSARLIQSAGVEGSKALFVWTRAGEYTHYPEPRQDDTHLSPAGARQVAQLALDALVDLRDSTLAAVLPSR